MFSGPVLVLILSQLDFDIGLFAGILIQLYFGPLKAFPTNFGLQASAGPQLEF